MDNEQKEYRKTRLVLPPEVNEVFQSADNDTRDAYAVALRANGWTLQSISNSAGVTRERIRQIVAEGEWQVSLVDVSGYPLPMPPEKPVKAPREFVEPDPVKLARLVELQPLARQVRANSPLYRAEAEEFSKLVADVHMNDGVPLYRLAMRLEVTHGALRSRLGRYGLKLPVKGTSGVYNPIKAENRA